MTMRFERYGWPGGAEWLLANGPAAGPQVLIVPPLFEELNFTRTLVVGVARGLAARGIGAWIADLPGCGESERELESVTLADWRAAVAAAAGHVAERSGGAPHIAAFRGGCLLDDAAAAASCWRFAPVAGAGLLRQMERAQAIGDRESGRPAADAGAAVADLVGYRIGRVLRDGIAAAAPATPPERLRAVPFAGPGVGLWRRAEPASDPMLAETLAADLAAWIA